MHFSCNGTRIALDNRHGDVSFVSHAHSDHAGGVKGQQRILASAETIALAGLSQSQNTKVDGATLFDAGHILGSRQLLLEHDGVVSVYTGDISLKKNIFGHSGEVLHCDRLIIEATYGRNPVYKFPAYEEIYSLISAWIHANENANLLIGCYDVGKAQEMVKIINECGVAPVVTEKAENICSIYEQFGISLERLVIGSEEAEEVMNRGFVAIVQMRHAKRYFAKNLEKAFGRRTLVAVATGWALTYRFDTDAAFPLSDHADFFELAEYVNKSGAKDVEFFAGDGSRILRYLKDGYI